MSVKQRNLILVLGLGIILAVLVLVYRSVNNNGPTAGEEVTEQQPVLGGSQTPLQTNPDVNFADTDLNSWDFEDPNDDMIF